jgi:hypothetical protein
MILEILSENQLAEEIKKLHLIPQDTLTNRNFC